MHSSFDFASPSRRRFLATAALACVASPNVRAAPAEPRNAMTLGFSTYGARGITTEQVLPILSVTGYDAVELTATKGFDAAPENMSTARRRQVKRILYDTELVLTSLMEHTVPADEAKINSGNLKRIEAASELVRVTQYLGAQITSVLNPNYFAAVLNLCRCKKYVDCPSK